MKKTIEQKTESPADGIMHPPTSIGKIIKHLGPGIVIAGSIVGSGELIATTLLGAQAGFTLLWLIILGCVIKVFVQVEFGRHTIIWSKTPLKALNDLPGPRVRRVNWIIMYWVMMTCLVITQQGGILGGIGQAVTMIKPLTESGHEYNQLSSAAIREKVNVAIDYNSLQNSAAAESAPKTIPGLSIKSPPDVRYWTIIIAVLTSILLFFGRFMLIQWVSTILVFGFTVTSFINLAMLQTHDQWAIKWGDLLQGLSFDLPGGDITIALAAFGMIGVGAAELITYPYWCLEKGYAKYTGNNDHTVSWLQRAKGWIRIMKIDAMTCMVVYTFSTIAFYLMGAAVLGRVKLMPQKGDLIQTLSEMYVPVFGSWAQVVFVVGAIAVLFSTFFLVAAGHARMIVDALILFRLMPDNEQRRLYWSRIISCVWPLVALGLYLWFESPVQMVLWSGIAQALMLPMLGFAALVYRYRFTANELKPDRWWDVLLWLSIAGMFLVGFWAVYSAW